MYSIPKAKTQKMDFKAQVEKGIKKEKPRRTKKEKAERTHYSYNDNQSWGFPGGSVVRTQHFHRHGLGSTPGQETKISQACVCVCVCVCG